MRIQHSRLGNRLLQPHCLARMNVQKAMLPQ